MVDSRPSPTASQDPSAQDRDTYEWWQTGIVYQIYPASFQDSNGDGWGDLRGILNRLDYLESLGIDAVWLSPIFPSPMHDHGYDVSDYRDISPLFGTLEDFDRLLEGLHDRGLRLLLDFVPNHTSDEHPWFLESRSDRTNPKRDWYIWKDPAPDGGPPNNWLSYFGGPAWTFDETTGQYYLHQFVKQQPELNFRHPEVLPAMLDHLRFWFDRGVDGFRVDVVSLLLKDPQFRDEPPNPNWDGKNPFERLLHPYTRDVEGIHQIAREFRRVADEYSGRVLVGEIYLPIDRLVRYYGDQDEFHLPFNFHLLLSSWDAEGIQKLVQDYEGQLPPRAWPNWVNGNHDQPRVASRVGPERARVANMLLLTLRGTPTVYYGEELGMINVDIPAESAQDPIARNLPDKAEALSRDQCRTPMQWDSSPQAGFTGGHPWLPISPDYRSRNVAAQHEKEDSPLALFRRLTQIRRNHPALTIGSYRPVETSDSGVLAYLRSDRGHDSFLVCLNFRASPRTLDLSFLAKTAQVTVSTGMNRRGEVDLRRLKLGSNEGLLLRLMDRR